MNIKVLLRKFAIGEYKRLFMSLKREKIHYIGGSDALPEALKRDEEERLIEKMPDQAAKNKLIEHNLRLVVYIAKRFENTNINIEDLISIGTIGLIKAVNTFKAEKKIKLATYASRCIENEILMFLRKHNAQKTEISFDEPLNVDWDGNELLLSDVLGTDENTVESSLEDAAELQLLKKAIERLSPRERQIIDMRFGLNGRREKTQKEVADMLGISQSYISRLEKKIMQRLKRDIAKES